MLGYRPHQLRPAPPLLCATLLCYLLYSLANHPPRLVLPSLLILWKVSMGISSLHHITSQIQRYPQIKGAIQYIA